MQKLNIVRSSVAVASLIVATIASGQGVRAAVDMPPVPPQPHTVIDLGEDAAANGITDSGRIVGSKNFGGVDRHASFWPNNHSPAVDLGTLPGFAASRGLGINPRGQMVGAAFPLSSARPLFWAASQSAPMELPGLSVGFAGIASDINPVGQIVGTFFSPDFSVQQPVFWPNSNAAPIYLRQVSDSFPIGTALSINASGNILGVTVDADFVEIHAVFWANSGSTPVALASPGGEFIYTDVDNGSGGVLAHALNNAGRMVGVAYNVDFSETRAVYWARSSSPAVILNTTDEFNNGYATAINDNGHIVGFAFNSGFSDMHAFLWPTPNSQGIDLNTLIPSNSGWELQVSRSINNRGEIIGAGILNGAVHAYALIPAH